MNEMTASECGSVDLQTVIANLQARLSDNEHERSELQNSLHARSLLNLGSIHSCSIKKMKLLLELLAETKYVTTATANCQL